MNVALCESPSLPRGSTHIVVATYSYNRRENDIGFNDNNYLWDLGLTNADVFWYRRVQAQEPLRSQINGPCGMKLHERLLLPNYGRDGAAFFDHVLEVYDHPPKIIIFLHGHAAVAWHTSCESVFARTAYVYRDYARISHPGYKITILNNKTCQNHMMTLTSPPEGTIDFNLNWFGGIVEENTTNDDWRRRRRLRLLSNETNADNEAKSPCQLFRERWHEKVFSRMKWPLYGSCCASFVLPGERIRRYPKAFYEDLKSVLTDTSHEDQGRECFEFLVYGLFGEEPGQFTKQDLQAMYDEADGLVHGQKRSATVAYPDQSILYRIQQNCKGTSEFYHKYYIVRRKWRNTWKRFGFYKAQT
jgi:hypothetical protein